MNPTIPPGVAPSVVAPTPIVPPTGSRFNGRRFVAAILLLVAGTLAAISTAVSWWIISVSGSSSTSITFFPGNSLHVSSNGQSQTGTYAQVQLGPVGGLYEAILVLAIVIAVLALITGVLLLLGALGRLRNPGLNSMFRGLIIAVFVITLVLVVVVPATQGALIRQSAIGGQVFCSLNNASTTPCSSFWGSSSGSGNTDTWGADVGWYLTLAATVMVAVGLWLWIAARRAPWGGSGTVPAPTMYPSVTPTWVPTQETPVDKLMRAKALQNAGQITPAEFDELKARLIPQVASAESVLSGASGARPEDELGKLTALHDAGALSDAEYADLRKKVLTRF